MDFVSLREEAERKYPNLHVGGYTFSDLIRVAEHQTRRAEAWKTIARAEPRVESVIEEPTSPVGRLRRIK